MTLQNNDNAQMKTYEIKTQVILPNCDGSFTPCPELLTEEEAIKYLRLDVNGPKNPKSTLKYYRDKGFLRGEYNHVTSSNSWSGVIVLRNDAFLFPKQVKGLLGSLHFSSRET